MNNTVFIFICLICVFMVLPICLSSFLKGKYPRKVWIGVLLAFIFFPFGQCYLEEATWYIVGLWLTFSLFKLLFPEIAWLSASIISGMIMYYRLLP